MCDAVDGRFLTEGTVPALRTAAEQARADGIDAVFVADGPLGDAVVLAAALGASTAEILLGVRISLTEEAHRHPTLLSREMSAFDQVCGGRAVLAFTSPFTNATGEAIALCRDMWRQGVAASEGPHYPVAGAINRPGPRRDGGPPIALDLTDGAAADASVLALVDLLLIPTGPSERSGLPPGVEVCQIQNA